MWRPDDWENPEKRTIDDVNKSYPGGVPKGYHILQEAGYHEGFEAGADAILEALRKGGNHLITERTIWHPDGVMGTRVFIPDEVVVAKVS